MRKLRKKFDPEKLEAEYVPNTIGCDGEDPHARVIKDMYKAGKTENAHKLFQKFHDRFATKPGFEWLDRIQDKKYKP